MRVLLSTRAVNEQLKETRAREGERKRKRKNRRKEEEKELFFTCQHRYQGWLGLYFLEQERKKKRERERINKK